MNINEEIANLNASAKVRKQVQNLLHKFAAETQKILLLKNNEIERKDAQLVSKEAHIQRLSFELARLKRLRFGKISEQFKAAGQMELFEENLFADIEALETELEQLSTTPEVAVAKKNHKGRKALPPELPRVETRHEPDSCTCGQCGTELIKIREDVTELLDVTPAKFFVQKHIYPQYACRSCETIEAVPVAPAIIDGGMATPGILAWLLVGKYVDHSPLYRMEQIAARSGVSLARSTLAEWVGRTGVALRPLADRLRELLLERTILHADETPVAQLDPGKGKTKRAYLWAYCSHSWDTGPPLLVFEYQGGRSGSHAKKFLNGWAGHLMVDNYAGYNAFVNTS